MIKLRIFKCLYSTTLFLSATIFLIFPLSGCRNTPQSGSGGQEVVVYTALDNIYAEPILKRFEQLTGIKVQAVYDAEAAKTTGLVSRLVAERARPRCDVFWNNEILRTIQLKQQGLLEPYASPSAAGIPSPFKDPEGTWTGFAARARVLAYNTKLIRPGEVPQSLKALADPRWRGKVAMAYPLFGTTASHAAVLYQKWGRTAALDFFKSLKSNDIKIMEGNGASCRAVADGELPLALTDSDDASLATGEGKPLAWTLIADEPQGGGLLIPNTVALIKGCPHPEAGRKLIDTLLSAEVEAALAASPSIQIPLRPGVAAPPAVQAMAQAKFSDPNYSQSTGMLEVSADDLKAVFARP